MRVLLTNDDGINAPGLASMETIARAISDDIWVVAPEVDQSGLAHSMTLNDPLRLRRIDDRKFAVRGTPTDCVIMAIREVMPEAPDLVLSGVNSGQNIADDVTYSGTVAGAIEGTLLGVRSIALSQAYNWDNGRVVPWETVESHAPDLIRKLIDFDLPEGTLLNVNVPNCAPADVAGVQVTCQGKLTHGMFLDERQDGRGFPYYWLRFERQIPGNSPDSDIMALKNNKISVTPLHLDLTAHEVRESLRLQLGV
ncbi:MAG: 5'/3'-nucleotidase SurE [Pseudomonadota bacterium]